MKSIFGIDVSGLKHLIKEFTAKIFSDNNVTINNINVDKSSKVVNINLAGASSEDKKVLVEILEETINEGYTLIGDGAKKLIDDLRTEESTPESEKTLRFFAGKVSEKDLKIIRGALLIKAKVVKGENWQGIKEDLGYRYGERARNIINMCGEGYFERYFIPYYNFLIQEGFEEEDAKASFAEFFSAIARELPFSVFVCQTMSPEETRDTLLSKVSKLRKYGFPHINIHGIGGRNIKVIKDIVEKFLQENDKVKKESEFSEPGRLSIRLGIIN